MKSTLFRDALGWAALVVMLVNVLLLSAAAIAVTILATQDCHAYEHGGRAYHVMAPGSEGGYRERGVASWYGPRFQGRHTASGSVYNMFDMTAAHKTLPLPCYVRVTNLRNHRVIYAKVTDRGPYVGKRVIDLSYAAAAQLDMLWRGTAPVVVEVVSYDELPGVLAAPAELGVRVADALPAASRFLARVEFRLGGDAKRGLQPRVSAALIPVAWFDGLAQPVVERRCAHDYRRLLSNGLAVRLPGHEGSRGGIEVAGRLSTS